MTILSEVMADIERKVQEVDERLYSVAMAMHRSNENEGVVLVYRPFEDDWITWRWYANGVNPLQLHTGHYDMDYDEAMMDFESRVAR